MSNTLAAVTPKILAQGLMALRSANVMPRLVNSDYSAEFAQKGTTVDVPVPAAIAVQDVAPDNVPPSTGDIAPTTVPITLDQWKEAPFYMTDKDMQQAMSGVLPMQASEAIKSLVNEVNAYLLLLGRKFYSYAGSAGTTPFASDTTFATELRKKLNQELAPKQNRVAVIDPDAEANALNLRAFQDASFSGSPDAIREGEITRKLGFDWVSDQQVATWTPGTLGGTETGAALVAGVGGAEHPLNQTVVALDHTSLTGTIKEGDVFTVAGDLQTYVCTALVTASGNAIAAMNYYPANRTVWANNAKLTLKAAHVLNIAFQRNAIAFASRPLADAEGLGNIIQSAVDPETGMALRLEVSREHKRTRWSFDILYGGNVVRRELGVRGAG